MKTKNELQLKIVADKTDLIKTDSIDASPKERDLNRKTLERETSFSSTDLVKVNLEFFLHKKTPLEYLHSLDSFSKPNQDSIISLIDKHPNSKALSMLFATIKSKMTHASQEKNFYKKMALVKNTK